MSSSVAPISLCDSLINYELRVSIVGAADLGSEALLGHRTHLRE